MQASSIPIYLAGYLVEVPFRVSHIEHLKASALFLNVHTEQSHEEPSVSSKDLTVFFGLQVKKTHINYLVCAISSVWCRPDHEFDSHTGLS